MREFLDWFKATRNGGAIPASAGAFR